MSENRKNIVRARLDPANLSQVAVSNANVNGVVEIDYSDIPELSDDWFEKASRGSHVPSKMPVSLRLDDDVLAFFKAQGSRYQTRINAVLRAYVESQRQKAHLP